MRVAQCYAPSDKAKALDLLRNAFNATREMDDDDSHTRANVQESILRAIIPLDPPAVDELLPYADPSSRAQVLGDMIGYYQRTKHLDRAVNLIYRISQESEFPYAPASILMKKLPPSDSQTVLQLFTTALGSYRDHTHNGIVLGGGNFDVLIRNFWSRLPPELVKEAIDEVLKQATNADKDQQNLQVSVAGPKGAVSLSYLEFLVFEMEPILRQIDEAAADELLKKYAGVKASLAKYPDGMNSLGSQDDNNRGTSFMVGSAGSELGGGSPMAQGQAQSAKIIADCEAHPHDAVASALAISDKRVRANALAEIASRVWKKSPSDANEALKHVVDLATEENNPAKGMMDAAILNSAARIYLKIGEDDSAKTVVEKGLKLAAELKKDDENPDDPNTALKAYWPSTDAFVRFTATAGQISPAWAMQTLKSVQDPEIRSLTESSLAGTWLNISFGTSEIHIQKKKTSLMLVRTDDDK